MGMAELFVLALGLAMDAFAVSVCKGLSLGSIKTKHMVSAGLWFGGFQALMPLIGYGLGSVFADRIAQYSHWIAFALLLYIGVNMIRESLSKEEAMDASMSAVTMLLLAIATSIDALAVGVTFAFLRVNIVTAVLFIGAVTFVVSAIGIKIGSIFGSRWKAKAELCGGLILIAIGCKLLLEGVGIV